MKQRHLDPYLIEIILHYVNRLDQRKEEIITVHYTEIYDQQLAIGPYSLFFGLLTIDWVPQQDVYLKTIGKDISRNQSIYTIKTIIKMCWDYVYEMWLLRNTHQHDAKEGPVNFKRLQLLQEIKDLYEKQGNMLSADRDIFSAPQSSREHHTITQLQEYVRFAKPITKKSIEDAREHGKRFRKIPEYFKVIKSTKRKKKKEKENHRGSYTMEKERTRKGITHPSPGDM